MRAHLGTAAYLYKAIVLKLRTVMQVVGAFMVTFGEAESLVHPSHLQENENES